MKKAKNRTAVTVITMLAIALVVLSFYFYISYRTNPMKETSIENMTEAQKLIAKDLQENYPPTPREVVKLLGSIMKVLYDNVEDEDAEPLALKVRELYDKEFLANNPEETYIKNLYSDIADWKDKDRTITSYILVNDELEQQEVSIAKIRTSSVIITSILSQPVILGGSTKLVK